MFLYKTVIISALSVFLCTACISISYDDPQIQIDQLQAQLVQFQASNKQIESQLATVTNSLKNNQNKVTELVALNSSCQNDLAQVTTALSNRKQSAATACIQLKNWNEKTILGETEWVYISIAKSNYRARIDTGAATSSINAAGIERFERDGKKWLRFTLNNENDTEPQIIEAKIERIVRIAQSTNDEQTERRYVVKLHVRIGKISEQTEFTLTDRSHMEYPVLIGRTFLQDIALVDVSKEYIHSQYKAK